MPRNSPRILVVDDDLMLRTMAGRALERAGHHVVLVDSGEACLAAFESRDFDLLLLDVMMPGIDGFQVCRALRQHPRGRYLPIFMLTGLDDTESVDAAYQAGATDFIVKPINWNLLVHRVNYGLRAGHATRELLASETRLANAQRLARMGSWEWWPAEAAWTCSEEYRRVLEISQAEWDQSGPEAILARLDDDDRLALRALRDQAMSRGHGYRLRFSCRLADGGRRHFSEEVVVQRGPGGAVSKLDGVMQDITEQLASEERIRLLSFYDQVTGLPTRNFFMEMARHALDLAGRIRRQCALVYVDLDRFRMINHAYGNEVGDQVLREIAGRIESSLRVSDLKGTTQTGDELTGRAGGDEFVLLLNNLNDVQDATRVVARMRGAINQPIHIGANEVFVTASMGIAISPRHGENLEALIGNAERGVESARTLGRDTYSLCGEDLGAAALSRVKLANDLRHALLEGGLELFYQPQVRVPIGAVVGAEALVRWRHPEQGLLAPGAFLPVAEDAGMMIALGNLVAGLACRDIQAWERAGLPLVPISINLAAQNFHDPNLLASLTESLERYGLSAGRLTLEVTETTLVTQQGVTLERLRQLRDAGFRLALDDFGTGYSSLNYLKRFPVHELKIDRSFVREVESNRHDRAIVAMLVALARELDLELVAEGVETAGQASRIQALGCPVIQGYYFSKPMPADDFAALLRRPNAYAASCAAFAAEPTRTGFS
jgi:diguanylate cyclase (GGDEF)-like protein